MGAVDQLAKRKAPSVCGNCPHENHWHEQSQHGGGAKIGGRCNYPGCPCGTAEGSVRVGRGGYEPLSKDWRI